MKPLEILIPLCVIGISWFLLVRLFRQGRLLTPVGGLHLMMLVFMGIGPLSFPLVDPEGERIPTFQMQDCTARISYVFLAGYVLACLAQFRWERLRRARHQEIGMTKPSISLTWALVLIFLSAVGYMVSRFDFATSGVGTLFVVFKTLLYPTIVLLVAGLRRNDLASILVLAITLVLGAWYSFMAEWRSELIMFAASIGFGITLRKGVRLWKLALLGAAFAFAVLPFLQLKKQFYEQVKADPWGAIVYAQQLSAAERLNVVGRFCAIRLNYIREMVYVLNGIEEGRTVARKGETYVDAALQLIPRVLWRDKPSFNQKAGQQLPREIGLVSEDDTATSWAVNLFGEFIWNFDYRWLPLVVPLVFYLCLQLEWSINRIFRHEEWRAFTQIVMFFLILGMVSLIYSITYLVWCTLVTLGFDTLKERSGVPMRLSRRDRQAEASEPSTEVPAPAVAETLPLRRRGPRKNPGYHRRLVRRPLR